MKKTNKIPSDMALCWTKKVEVLKAQKAILDTSKKSRNLI